MYNPFHGNVTIEFNDNTNMKVHSLILSWNSATFCYLFNQLRQTNIEIKDFTKEAVILYLESLYTGKLELEKSLFRELNKLSFAFKTRWLSDLCTEFFCKLCESTSHEFEDLCFLFNEALYANDKQKNGDLIIMVVGHLSKIERIASIFVERYLTENYATITSQALDQILSTCSEDYVPVLRSLKQHLVGTTHLVDGDIHETTRSLLSNSKTVACLASNLDIYEEVCELLAFKSGNMTGDDFKMLTNLNLCVIRASRGASKTLRRRVVGYIPNLFQDRELFDGLSGEEIIERISSVAINSFMIIEMFNFLSLGEHNKIQKNLAQIFASKLLCRVTGKFVRNFSRLDFSKIVPQSVISEDDTVVIMSKETTIERLISTSEFYKLYFKHPAAPQCENHAQCGFMLQVTPCSKEEAGRFNIELVSEESEYPADIHCHSEVISAAHMHLVVEHLVIENLTMTGRWCNLYISWKRKPEYRDKIEDKVWGTCNDSIVRLVVYYDVRDKKQ